MNVVVFGVPILGLFGLFAYLYVRTNRTIERALAEPTRLERGARLAYDGPPIEEIVAGADPQLIAEELRHEARDEAGGRR